ncbi:hypothetical protein ACH5RR_033512 [Cinchona calisaya]|uniref:J domain-containing protein n=1 Tax=Cinchona calisaya TaxID=153742 RepID=A0ABD2YL64_9GENT
MGRAKSDSDSKSLLVTEICNIPNCAHHHHFHSKNSPFVDWWMRMQGLISLESITLDLATLQLHPDKNKDPKADIAFKLVSEAYACLSDNANRTAFNLERQKNFCFKCRNIPDPSNDPSILSSTKVKRISTLERERSNHMLQRMKDLRARFVQEASVIENCLKVNAASSRISSDSTRKELQTFNPADYLSQGYPHPTTRNHKKLERSMSKNHVLHILHVKP